MESHHSLSQLLIEQDEDHNQPRQRHNESIFHGNCIEKELETLHRVALSEHNRHNAADYVGPLTVFKDKAMDVTIKKGKKPRVPPPRRRP